MKRKEGSRKGERESKKVRKGRDGGKGSHRDGRRRERGKDRKAKKSFHSDNSTERLDGLHLLPETDTASVGASYSQNERNRGEQLSYTKQLFSCFP